MTIRFMVDLEKNRLPWGAVALRRHAPHVLRRGGYTPVHAFDTETLNGYAKLICSSDKSFSVIRYIDDALNFLTKRAYRDSLNFFFNIDFDRDAILKYLDVDTMKTLVKHKEATWGDITITYIPGKVWSLKRGKNKWTYYDISQFYEGNLETLSQKHLGQQKNPEGLDRELIGSSIDYWREHYDEIVRYCILDAQLTAGLGELLRDEIASTIGFYPKYYYSKATLSKQYFRSVCDIPPTNIVPRDVLRYAWHSYKGGRFEITSKGHVGECTNYDIHSAYPYQIANLLDLRYGKWHVTRDLHADADYGFYLAKVKIPYMRLCPLPRYWKNTVIYPYGTWYTYTTKAELENLPPGCHYEIIRGHEFTATKRVYPFRDTINYLYQKKQAAGKGDYRYDLYKILMNGFYGAFYEKWAIPDGKLKAGLLFNPVYASVITANTRVQLYTTAINLGDCCVSLATDGILCRGQPKIDVGPNLGQWGAEAPADTYLLRSGIYQYGEESKQRGLMTSKRYLTPFGSYPSLFAYIKTMPHLNTYPVVNYRPLHMAEALKRADSKHVEKINIFGKHTVNIDVTRDIKRIWDDNDLHGYDLIQREIKSQPRNLMDNPYHEP